MKILKLLSFLIVLCALTVALVACGEKKIPEVKESTQEPIVTPVEEEPVAQIPNPVVEYETVEDAVIQVGHLCSIPDIYARYNQKASVIGDTLIQIDFSDDNGEILTLREEAGVAEDISGDYNQYAYNGSFESDGNTVTVKGDSEDSIKVVTWNDGAYAHSISYVNGASLEEVTTAVNNIK